MTRAGIKKRTANLLQIVVVLIGVAAVALLLWEPNIEGRNTHATLSEVYFRDPFLACAYIASRRSSRSSSRRSSSWGSRAKAAVSPMRL